MKITDIVEQKNNKDRFSVSVDGRYSFSLNTNDLLSAKLAVGNDISESEIESFRQRSADSLVMARTYEKCLRRPHSEREIRDYLFRKRVDSALADDIITNCYRLKLLDDARFAESWVTHRRKNSKSDRFIRGELRSKGVEQSIVDSVLGDEGDRNQLRKLIDKKQRRYVDDEKKFIAYLQRQGFSYSDIREELTNRADSEMDDGHDQI